MLIEITKQELIKMIKGFSPTFKYMNDYIENGFGHWIGGFVDEWSWDDNFLNKLNEKQLLLLFEKLKKERTDYEKN
jgi:hypothetical protein